MSSNAFRCCVADICEEHLFDAFSLVADEVEFGFGGDS